MTRSLKRSSSGQILLISTLIIALIMTSTAIYIYECPTDAQDSSAYLLNDYIQSIKLGSKHTVIGALANVTQGGLSQTLTSNLDRWKNTVEKQYAHGKMILNYTLRDIFPYSSGLHINWTADGNGVSEAYVDFLLETHGNTMETRIGTCANISTRLHIQGFVTLIDPNTTQVTAYCHLLNEEQPATAKSLSLYYRESTSWTIAGSENDYSVNDYGNGTLRATFTLSNAVTSVDVSAHLLDERDIFVQANATFT